MARWDYRYLSAERFPESLSALEIEQFFALDEAGLAQVRQRRGPMNRLAFTIAPTTMEATISVKAIENQVNIASFALKTALYIDPYRMRAAFPMAGFVRCVAGSRRRRYNCGDARVRRIDPSRMA